LSDVACLINKEVFAKYRYRTNYAEDLDLGLRLVRDGYKLAFLGSSRIIHSHNRPPHYHLKRAYVDNVFLAQIFPNYPVTSHDVVQLIQQMGLIYQSLVYVLDETPWGLQFPCDTALFRTRFIDTFRAARMLTGKLRAQFGESALFDTHFTGFLNR